MSLTSLSFFFFFLLVFIGCLVLQKHNNQKKLLLLVVSYYFYMTIDWRFGLLLLLLTAINFIAGYFIATSKKHSTKKTALTCSIFLSIAILVYFKYANFFIESAVDLLGFGDPGRQEPLINVVLPIGISFMTFQAITYPIDLYAGRVEKQSSMLDFGLFMAFFPQLLSGPIVRASEFLPQLEDNKGFNGQHMMEGLSLIVKGLVKKVIIADILAVSLVNPAFDNPGQFSSAFLLLAAFGFSFQVYMDLSGYTDIALGTGRMLGYKLPINFNRPYLATSIANYWQRWHISMSSFFKDYLYDAISSWRWCGIYTKLTIVFVSIGLWHGAGWNFILYGFIHGCLVSLEHYQTERRKRLNLPVVRYRGGLLALKILQVFTIVSLTRILFRGNDLTASISFFGSILNPRSEAFPLSLQAALVLGLAVLLHFTPIRWRDYWQQVFIKSPVCITAGGVTAMIYILTAFSNGTNPFIYFKF